jgi:hypothetical protein
MFGRRKDRPEDARLDRLGRDLLRASAMKPEESDEAASSPFLFARIRAGVAAEQSRRAAPYDRLTLLAARRAIPVMLLIAVVSALALRLAATGPGSAGLETIAEASACSVTTREVVASEGCVITDEEVLATIISRDARGLPRGDGR